MTTPVESVDLAAQVRAAVRKARHASGDPRTAVNLRWLRSLSGASPAEILAVLGELDGLVPVEEEMRRRHIAGGRGNYAQIGAPFELYALVRLLRPTHLVETGVSSGVSSAHLLLALEKNHAGTLHSIDLPTPQKGPVLGKDESPVSIPPGLASGWAVPFRSPRWDLRIGDTRQLLPGLVDSLPSVDLFLHDDLHTEENLASELAILRPKLPPARSSSPTTRTGPETPFPGSRRRCGRRSTSGAGRTSWASGSRLRAPARVPRRPPGRRVTPGLIRPDVSLRSDVRQSAGRTSRGASGQPGPGIGRGARGPEEVGVRSARPRDREESRAEGRLHDARRDPRRTGLHPALPSLRV